MTQPVAIRFNKSERELINAYAKSVNSNFSQIVRDAVRTYISPDFGKGYYSLKDISENKETDITSALNQFLDNFAHAKEKELLIQDEPTWSQSEAGRWYYDFAATAHKLADDYRLPVPAWCLKPEYFAKEPYYAFNTKNTEFKVYLEETTPAEFKWHGLYLGPNILTRR